MHLIYIPGLGEQRVDWQRRTVAAWRVLGVTTELFQVHWSDGEHWDAKFARLLSLLDSRVAEGRSVGLIGRVDRRERRSFGIYLRIRSSCRDACRRRMHRWQVRPSSELV